MSICFLFGHRDTPDDIRDALAAAIEARVREGVTEFVVGHYGHFDSLAAQALAAAKRAHPTLRLTLLLPYHPATRAVELPDGFDGSLYPENMERVPPQMAIVRANRWMADHCDCAITYAWQPGSNAKKLAGHARRRIPCYNLSHERA